MITDEGQEIVWEASHTPFGTALISVDELENNLRFPGQYFDRETNLHYNYFRDYDSEYGIYTTSDPIGLAGGINTRAYALANPLRLIDPSGLEGLIDESIITAPGDPSRGTGVLMVGAGGEAMIGAVGFVLHSNFVFTGEGTVCWYTAQCIRGGFGIGGALDLLIFSLGVSSVVGCNSAAYCTEIIFSVRCECPL